jgi:hypothetical protein
VQVFFITAAAFGALSLYGYTTQRSLSGMGSFLLMGLIGLILASLVNIFLASSALQFVISVIGVLIFAGLTAYDTQKLKEMYLYELGTLDGEIAVNASIFGALTLYPEVYREATGLRAWRGLPDGVGRASTVARDRTRTRRLRARGQRRTGFEDFRIGGHRGVPGQATVSEGLSG